MKLLLDQGLPRGAVQRLLDHGIEATHVGTLNMNRAEDEAILAEALRTGAIVVTLDSDFHALLAEMKARGPSVIRIRMDGLKEDLLARLLSAVVERTSESLQNGAAVSVTRHRIRVRKLPFKPQSL